MKLTNITISTNNSKLGIIPNLSLPPVKTCIKKPPCTNSCYARRVVLRYPNAKKAYENNLNALLSDSTAFFEEINHYLSLFSPKFFRIHSSGDFMIGTIKESQNYLNQWAMLADKFSDIKFLAFTKCYYLDYSNIPDNFSVVFSAWFNYPMPTLPNKIKGIAWVQNSAELEKRIPKNSFLCSGKCDDCGFCWHMSRGQNVTLPLH